MVTAMNSPGKPCAHTHGTHSICTNEECSSFGEPCPWQDFKGEGWCEKAGEIMEAKSCTQ